MKSGAERGNEVTASGSEAVAVGGDAENVVIGDHSTLIVHQARPRVRRSVVLAGVAALVVAGAGVGWLVLGDGKPAEVPIGAAWPARLTACDQTSRAAMPRGGADIGALDLGFDNDPRNSAASLGAASWKAGLLTVSVSAVDDPVTVTRLRPVIRKVDTPPYAWTLSHPSGCGGNNPPVFPELDLDTGKLKVKKPDGSWVEVGTAVDGITGTLVEKGGTQLVFLKVLSCEASYEWSLEVGYVVGGVDRTTSLGPFRSAGKLDGVPAYQLGTRSDGPGRVLVPLDPGKDSVDPCAVTA
ncbi:hypothetical protein [Kitasatospora sp. NPDC004289]